MRRGGGATRASGNVGAWERIVAVRLDNIGDVIMLGPALRALRRAAPGARIALLTSAAGASAAPLLPWIDDVIVHRAVWQEVGGTAAFDPAHELRFVDDLAARGFDAGFVFTSFSQSPHPPAYMLCLAGVPFRIGESKEFGGAVLSEAVPPAGDSLHQTERNLRLVEAAGIEVVDRSLELHVPPAAFERAAALLADAGVDDPQPVVAAPAASCSARTYEPERMGRALAIVGDECGKQVVLVGRDGEQEVLERVIQASGRHPALVPLVGRTSVPELAAVVGRAALVVCNNSGPLHMADAFRRPVVVLYSGSDLESQWRPRAAPSVLLRRPTWCSPCYELTCPYSLECLDISPEEVAHAVLDLLARTRQVRATA